jgi:UDP-N-acetylmuramate: L-alanyl-gamma-D-glutamyl-meso-diaminopimelate ligase
MMAGNNARVSLVKGLKMTSTHKKELPKDVRNIHLIAVCGTGMGALACLLKELGYGVTGSDQQVYPPMSDFLIRKGISLFEGYSADNLSHSPDLIVVGNAVSKDNPEVQAMQARAVPYCSMPQAINRFAAAGKKQIVVTGTHGKTTTSSFIAWMLTCAGLDPSFLIGGIVSDFNSNYRLGQGEFMVLEGDEYDTAFFDKGPKFLHYMPEIAILTSVEFDHADIFRDLDHIKNTFGRLLSGMPSESILFAFDQDMNIADILPESSCRVDMYGHHQDAAWHLGEFNIEPPFTRFEVFHKGSPWAEFKTRMIGQHNLRNLLAGIAAGAHIGVSKTDIAKALETFKGVRRRQEVRGVKNGITVIDDFAHHPTAVLETINAVKSFYEENRVFAVFEPRTNSSRRTVFQSVYADAFDRADMVCIRQAPMLEKIPPDQRFSSQQLVEDLRQKGRQAFYFPDTDAIIEFLLARVCPGDVLLIMSNGGFDNIHARLLEAL